MRSIVENSELMFPSRDRFADAGASRRIPTLANPPCDTDTTAAEQTATQYQGDVMRPSKIWMLVVLCTVCSAQAYDPPKQKPGLWAITTTIAGVPPISGKTCVDAKTSQAYLDTAVQAQKACSKMETHVSGSTVTRDGVCKVGATQMTVHGVTTFKGDSEYKAESHTRFDPPIAGKAESSTIVEGKWLSATCAPGMKPGDTMMEDGQIISHDGKPVSGNTGVK